MPKTQGISGTAVGLASVGGLLVYAAITDQTLPDALRGLVKGVASKPAPFAAKPVLSGAAGGTAAQGSTIGSALANAALKYKGRPYKWGGTFSCPTCGGDCSGLVFRSFLDIGINFPRVSAAQLTTKLVRSINRLEVTTGDLVGRFGAPGHIGIALNNTTGLFAPRPGTVVQEQPIDKVILRFNGIYVRYNGPAPVMTARSRRAE